ncbi:methyltransferase [Nocardioides acrostichi]|uniref:Isoprenylcysteine carboxylmethyltransferase family protein n=1 Tax=Nocardioides acrostichi TaxID=2784339 RepID=A0A930UX14_9ACTN|nr:methyltransferase [Nocardioides acrostichi]MBF4161247.1 isoprenylcysteine carboxylmethyltransferase family protein [Nocardioides acrostichi]
MTHADLLRNLLLLVPVVAVLTAAAVRRPDRSTVATAGLSSLLVVVGLMAVEVGTDWWAWAATPTAVLGVPTEAIAGWALIWGALPALVGGGVRAWPMWLLGFAWADALLMPRLAPLVVLVVLDDAWWHGEVLLLLAVALPALALATATRRRHWLTLRVLLQMGVFTGLVGWLTPTLALRHDGLGWSDVVDHRLGVRTTLLVVAAVAGVPTLAAVAELARVGHGTSWPWDPPDRLVTTGPYAYLANPMQLGASLLLLVLALAAGSPTLALGAVVAAVFSAVLAERHEHDTLSARWPEYSAYRRAVHAWRPRWRPYLTPVNGLATLLVSDDCGLCRATGDTLWRLHPVGLHRQAAESADRPVTRMTWAGSAPTEVGIAALGRALEHTTLAAAWWGWAVRLPVVRPCLQVVLDACGLGPRRLRTPAPLRSTGTERLTP